MATLIAQRSHACSTEECTWILAASSNRIGKHSPASACKSRPKKSMIIHMICALFQELFLRRTNTLSGSDAKIAAMTRFKTVAPFTINTLSLIHI